MYESIHTFSWYVCSSGASVCSTCMNQSILSLDLCVPVVLLFVPHVWINPYFILICVFQLCFSLFNMYELIHTFSWFVCSSSASVCSTCMNQSILSLDMCVPVVLLFVPHVWINPYFILICVFQWYFSLFHMYESIHTFSWFVCSSGASVCSTCMNQSILYLDLCVPVVLQFVPHVWINPYFILICVFQWCFSLFHMYESIHTFSWYVCSSGASVCSTCMNQSILYLDLCVPVVLQFVPHVWTNPYFLLICVFQWYFSLFHMYESIHTFSWFVCSSGALVCSTCMNQSILSLDLCVPVVLQFVPHVWTNPYFLLICVFQ